MSYVDTCWLHQDFKPHKGAEQTSLSKQGLKPVFPYGISAQLASWLMYIIGSGARVSGLSPKLP